MRTAAALFALLSTASAGLSFFGSDDVSGADESLKVPGQSPLEFCPKDHTDDLLTIQSVNLSPNPPEAGTELVIEATGVVAETIEQGAYVNLQVKYGLIRLISTTADLCEQIQNVELECPIEKGPISIVKSIDLPREIPPGKYTVLADVFTAKGEPITCLTATVVFDRGDNSFNVEL